MTFCYTPSLLTRSLVAVKPRRPPKTNADTETAFRHDHCKTRVHIQKVNISEVRGQLIRSNSEVRVHAGVKFGHTGCWSIAKCSHPGTSQVDFQVDRPPPANSPPGDLLITMVKEAVILYKKVFRKMKKVVSLIDLKVMKTRNDCEIACDCVKRANVVLHVGLCKEIFARKHTATHKPTSAQPLTATSVTSDNRLWSP